MTIYSTCIIVDLQGDFDNVIAIDLLYILRNAGLLYVNMNTL